MLKLINITKNEKNIEADYVPETSNIKAHISMDIENYEYSCESLEDYGEEYCRMAANGLIRTLKELQAGKIKEVPKERLVMWY